MNANDEMIMFLIHNQQSIKNLVQPYTSQYNQLLELEDPIFIDDIQKQYKDVIRWIIVRQLMENTPASVEDAFIFLDEFNLTDYLR